MTAPTSHYALAKGIVSDNAEVYLVSDLANSLDTVDTKLYNGSAKAWAFFSSTPTIGTSYNVSSVTKGGTGVYVVNWSTTFTDNNYVVIATAMSDAALFCHLENSALSNTSATINVRNTSGTLTDPNFLYVVAFGPKAV